MKSHSSASPKKSQAPSNVPLWRKLARQELQHCGCERISAKLKAPAALDKSRPSLGLRSVELDKRNLDPGFLQRS